MVRHKNLKLCYPISMAKLSFSIQKKSPEAPAKPDSKPRAKKILISFVSFDHDDFRKKRRKLDDPQKDEENASDFIKSFRQPDNTLPERPDQIWRPSIAQAQLYGISYRGRQPDLIFDDYYLLYVSPTSNDSRKNDPTKADYRTKLVKELEKEIRGLKPRDAMTKPPRVFVKNLSDIEDVFEYKDVYQGLLAFSQTPAFHANDTECYVNCSFGTTPIRNCLFLLTITGRFGNAKQISVSAWEHYWERTRRTVKGSYNCMDPRDILDAVKGIGTETARTIQEALAKDVFTRDEELFEKLCTVIESLKPLGPRTRRRLPILLTGDTGVGKTHLARNIRNALQEGGDKAPFRSINCATIVGADANIARAELFGSVKSAYTGATDTPGLLKEADNGVLFMDEIGELPLDMQSMLLTALDTGTFSPVGAPGVTVSSNFFLIAGTNKDLDRMVERGEFRRDLLNRINTWHFRLKSLKDLLTTREIAWQNCLKKFSAIKTDFGLSSHMNFSSEAKEKLLEYILDPNTLWTGNFREFNALLLRIALLANAKSGGITNVPVDIVEQQVTEARERQEGLQRIRQELAQEKQGIPHLVGGPPTVHVQQDAPSPSHASPQSVIEELDDTQRKRLSPLDRAQIAFIEDICHRENPRSLRELARAVYGDACSAKDEGASTLCSRLRSWNLHFNRGSLQLLGK